MIRKLGFVSLGFSLMSTVGMADTRKFAGSDSMLGMINDAIISAGLENEIQYIGGGSSAAEKAVVAGGSQGLLPMSREIKADAAKSLTDKGFKTIPHVIALDGIAIFVNGANTVAQMDLETVRKIFACETTKWEDVPNSGKSGAIEVVRRNDQSGTTDAFKAFTKVTFGACAQVLAETTDIANYTSTKPNSIGYSGLTARREGNKAVALSKAAGEAGVLPTVRNVRSFAYPMSRKLYVYEIKGNVAPVEEKLLAKMIDRSFMDPIVQDNEYYTID